MNIPSIKLSPYHILPLLEIMSKYENNVKEMKNEIHQYLLNNSTTGKISYRNAIFALTFPTFKILTLKSGQGNNVKLSYNGILLLKTYHDKGEDDYFRKLAQIIYNVDQENGDIINFILDNFNDNYFLLNELINKLKNSGYIEPNKGGKLTKWINLLNYVDLIHHNEFYKLNLFQLNAIKNNLVDIPLDVFFKASYKQYEKLKLMRRGNPYIPIPDLGNEVCKELQEYHLSTFDFKNYLKKLKNYDIEGKMIHFGKPGAREANGLRIDGIYYYYIAIFSERHGN